MKASYRRHFCLDSQIGHLNHGAYGATPLRVLRAQWAWQRAMESSPVEFHSRRLEGLMRQARQPLAEFLGSRVEDTAFMVNTTTAINWVARSLPLGPGDEVLLTDHEYGAIQRCFRVLSQERGFLVGEVAVPLGANLVEAVANRLTPQTRLLVVSHLTSASAQRLDVAALGGWARQRGLWTLIDGAHVPGQLELNLSELQVDFYAGNLHKWLWSPKGAALLWVDPKVQSLIRPINVSWGVEPPLPGVEPEWVAWCQMQATRDCSAFLAAPVGLDYHRKFSRGQVERSCWKRMEKLSQRLLGLGIEPLPWQRPARMRAFHWPYSNQPEQLQAFLWTRFRLEVPCYHWGGRVLFRISLQPYVCDSELERLLEGLSEARVSPGPN